MNLYRVSLKMRGQRKHKIGNFLADCASAGLHLALDYFTFPAGAEIIRITVSTIAEDIEGLDE